MEIIAQPRPRRIGGIKFYPKWDWTPDYARTVAKHSRAMSKGRPADQINAAYREWLDNPERICTMKIVEPKELIEIGERLYGYGWQTRMAEAVGVSDREVRNWKAGKYRVPEPAARLLRLLDQQNDKN